MLEFIERGKGAAPQQLTDENTEPNFDLVESGAMFGGVVKDNTMGGIAEKGSAGLLILQDAREALNAEIHLEIRFITTHRTKDSER